MATNPPRQKLFESTTNTSSLSLVFFLLSTVTIWLIYILVILSSSPVQVLGEVIVPPLDLTKDSDFLDRAPRSIIAFGSDDDGGSSSYNKPTVLEGDRKGKSLLGDGYETLRQLSLASPRPWIRRKLFNTSVALTVPMFSFTLPQKAAEGSTVDLANQAIFGLFALWTGMLVFAVPVVFTGIRPFDVYGRSSNGESSQDILDNLMGAGERSSHTVNLMGADLRNKIGLNPEECLQKSICDAHREPKRYGMFGLPFQLFFPPPSPDSINSGKSYSIYQMAAQTGEYKKTEECWEKYNCFFDVMELAMYLVDYFNPESNDEQENGI